MYSIEVVLSTSSLSLKPDSLQEEKKASSEDKLYSSHLSTLFGKTQMKKNPVTLYQCQGRCATTACGNMTRMLSDWIRLSRAQDQGLKFWQTKSNAIIVRDLLPADCIYNVISKNGGQALFERLSTPLPPKVALRSRWHSQQ